MNILFLDVDGVLNNTITETHFDEFNMRNLEQLVKSLNLKVVISSDWRRSGANLARLRSELEHLGIEIFGTTIISNKKRKNEIRHWLKTNVWSRAIVLDDLGKEECDPRFPNCIFHQTQYQFGLTEEDLDKISEKWRNLVQSI